MTNNKKVMVCEAEDSRMVGLKFDVPDLLAQSSDFAVKKFMKRYIAERFDIDMSGVSLTVTSEE